MWPLYKTHSLIPDWKPHWSWFPDVALSDRELITVEHKAHYFKHISREDFLLEILDKVRNKASCNELQSVWDWDRKKECQGRQRNRVVEIWYLMRKLITLELQPGSFFFFCVQKRFFILCFLLFDPTPPHTVGTLPKYFGRGRFPEAS